MDEEIIRKIMKKCTICKYSSVNIWEIKEQFICCCAIIVEQAIQIPYFFSPPWTLVKFIVL